MTATLSRSARFWDRFAAKYARQAISDQASYERKLEITQSYLKPTDRVLELGCGTGGTALAHAAHVAHIRATDFAPGMIKIARSKAEAAQVDNVTFETASVEGIEVEPGSLDVVLALNLLHLLDDPQAALARFHQWLKPGGLVIASTACIADILPIFRVVAPPLQLVGLIPKVSIFRERHLDDIHQREGFEIEQKWRPPGKRVALFMVARRSGLT